MFLSRPIALRRSAHLASRAISRVEPGPRGAPMRTASEGLILVKPSIGPSNGCWSREIKSHVEILRLKPSFIPSVRKSLVFEETMVLEPLRVTSSMKPTVSGDESEHNIC